MNSNSNSKRNFVFLVLVIAVVVGCGSESSTVTNQSDASDEIIQVASDALEIPMIDATADVLTEDSLTIAPDSIQNTSSSKAYVDSETNDDDDGGYYAGETFNDPNQVSSNIQDAIDTMNGTRSVELVEKEIDPSLLEVVNAIDLDDYETNF